MPLALTARSSAPASLEHQPRAEEAGDRARDQVGVGGAVDRDRADRPGHHGPGAAGDQAGLDGSNRLRLHGHGVAGAAVDRRREGEGAVGGRRQLLAAHVLEHQPLAHQPGERAAHRVGVMDAADREEHVGGLDRGVSALDGAGLVRGGRLGGHGHGEGCAGLPGAGEGDRAVRGDRDVRGQPDVQGQPGAGQAGDPAPDLEGGVLLAGGAEEGHGGEEAERDPCGGHGAHGWCPRWDGLAHHRSYVPRTPIWSQEWLAGSAMAPEESPSGLLTVCEP